MSPLSKDYLTIESNVKILHQINTEIYSLRKKSVSDSHTCVFKV